MERKRRRVRPPRDGRYDHRHRDDAHVDDVAGVGYTNGMQIFVMGFLEAGKAASRLATDAVVDAIGGMKQRRDHRDANFIDEIDEYDDDEPAAARGMGRRHRRRGVLDVDVLDYSPTPSRRRDVVVGSGKRVRRGGRSSEDRDELGGRRRTIGREAATVRGDDDVVVGAVVVDREGRSSPRRRRPDRDDGTISVDRRYRDHRPISPGGGDPDDAPLRLRRTVVRDGSEVGAPRTIYGLYHRDADKSTSPNEVVRDREEEDAEENIGHRPEQPSRWKDRLRRKFDVALGLKSPPSSSSPSMAGTYYDSWRAQIQGVDDGRKEVMRRRMNEMDDSSSATVASLEGEVVRRASPSSSSINRNNRRARMRAKKQTNALDSKVSPSSRSIDPPKSRLDEVPFWRETGSIASLLFENRPWSSSSGRGDRRVIGRKSLEVRSC